MLTVVRALLAFGLSAIVTVLLSAALMPGTACAQSCPTQDVVHLKDGGIVRGTIIERGSTESVKIQTADGSVFVYKLDQVQRITREALVGAPSGMQASMRASAPKKDPAVAFVLSLLIPGAGQVYNGEVGKGALQLGLDVGATVLWLTNVPGTDWSGYERDTGDAGLFNAGLAIMVVTDLWSMIDAPLSASAINRRNGQISMLQAHSVTLTPVALRAGHTSVTGLMVSCRF
jgi:TM2 domain-containing membrane protein YozV